MGSVTRAGVGTSVAVGELGFDPATQAELDAHEALDATDAVHGLAQATKITDASTSHSVSGVGTVSVSAINDALDALGAKQNVIIDAMEAAGISAAA